MQKRRWQNTFEPGAMDRHSPQEEPEVDYRHHLSGWIRRTNLLPYLHDLNPSICDSDLEVAGLLRADDPQCAFARALLERGIPDGQIKRRFAGGTERPQTVR